MADYFEMNREQLQAEHEVLEGLYKEYQARNLKLDMSRGKPCPEQLDLSMDMMKLEDYRGDNGTDSRNYGLLEGMPEARVFFADLMGVKPEEVIVRGFSALSLRYYLIVLGCRQGCVDCPENWNGGKKRKFICPVPGYDRHFRVTEYFGFELLSVPMTPDGPDMNQVEELVKDPTVRGIWCVPVYSNPDGYTYSDETVRRLAQMETGAPDFKIFWDDAYCVHHLTDHPQGTISILKECELAGYPERPLLFCSTSKITFPGAGVAAMAASRKNVEHILEHMFPMVISYDKMNQLRHVRFLKNKQGVLEHMKKHRAILEPKFRMVQDILESDVVPYGPIAWWTKPQGGYFISLYLQSGCAAKVVRLCKEAGVVLTGAGAAYPYGKDPDDHHIRIAPTFPSLEELEAACHLLAVCVRLATVEKLLQQ